MVKSGTSRLWLAPKVVTNDPNVKLGLVEPKNLPFCVV